MKIEHNISLKHYNTFGVDVNARTFSKVTSIDELQEIISKEKGIFILGGGSNLLLTQDIDKYVLLIDIRGIEIIKETKDHAYIKSYAGENWHEFVLWCITHGYGGLENLSLIPGNVGTSPIQNIGAYGVEIKDTFHSLETIDTETYNMHTFNKKECEFGYRNSIFKNELKGKHIITSVVFKLTKNNHKLNFSYGAIASELENRTIDNPTIKDISDVVITIRNSKLPNPKEIGNSGSFFKNPVISKEHYEVLQKKYPEIPSYIISETEIKVPAGWLIEQCGFKGKRYGDTGTHIKQALVLVNYGNAKGKDVFKLAQKIQHSIKKTFDINLDIEVNVI